MTENNDLPIEELLESLPEGHETMVSRDDLRALVEGLKKAAEIGPLLMTRDRQYRRCTAALAAIRTITQKTNFGARGHALKRITKIVNDLEKPAALTSPSEQPS